MKLTFKLLEIEIETFLKTTLSLLNIYIGGYGLFGFNILNVDTEYKGRSLLGIEYNFGHPYGPSLSVCLFGFRIVIFDWKSRQTKY